GTVAARLLAGEQIIHVADLKAEVLYSEGDPNRRAVVDLGGARTALAVALRKDGAPLGVIAIYRQEVRPFSDEQIALLQNFAQQGVIAKENARAADRDARGLGAADRDRRGIAGHQFVTRRPRTGVRCDIGEGTQPLWGSLRPPHDLGRRML